MSAASRSRQVQPVKGRASVRSLAAKRPSSAAIAGAARGGRGRRRRGRRASRAVSALRTASSTCPGPWSRTSMSTSTIWRTASDAPTFAAICCQSSSKQSGQVPRLARLVQCSEVPEHQSPLRGGGRQGLATSHGAQRTRNGSASRHAPARRWGPPPNVSPGPVGINVRQLQAPPVSELGEALACRLMHVVLGGDVAPEQLEACSKRTRAYRHPTRRCSLIKVRPKRAKPLLGPSGTRALKRGAVSRGRKSNPADSLPGGLVPPVMWYRKTEMVVWEKA